MTTIGSSSGQGALFELVARGVKDTYFVKDDPKKAVFPYDAQYDTACPHLAERRTMVPLNAPTFGGSFEVELDPYGDVMTECGFEIQLPSWIPPQLPLMASGPCMVEAETVNRLCPIQSVDMVGDSYGYVNGVGFFLFESIQLYQDQFLLQEWSGDGLYLRQCSLGSLGSTSMALVKGGVTGPGLRALQLRATPGRLRISLPLPGMQAPEDPGFPFCALPHQTFRFRVRLRRLEDLVVCSDATKWKPAPWSVPQFRYNGIDGFVQTFVPLTTLAMGQPTILLYTVQRYLSPDAQQALRGTPLQLPYRRSFENLFTFGDLDYAPLDRGGVAAVQRRLDARHPVERLTWFFRSSTALESNRLDQWTNDYFTTHGPSMTLPYPLGDSTAFYQRLKLLIAGKDRETLEAPLVWSTVETHAKDDHTAPLGIGSMDWTTGDSFGQSHPAPRQPEGTVNFTSADRPTLYLELAPVSVNPYLAQRRTEMRVVLDGWNAYEVRDGRGRPMFAN